MSNEQKVRPSGLGEPSPGDRPPPLIDCVRTHGGVAVPRSMRFDYGDAS